MAVPLNLSYSPREMDRVLKDASSRGLVRRSGPAPFTAKLTLLLTRRTCRLTFSIKPLQMMLSEHIVVQTGHTKFSRRFSSAVQGYLRLLEKHKAKGANYMKAEWARLRVIRPQSRPPFDAMMLHRGLRKASQIFSVTPSTVSHAFSGLRQSNGDEAIHSARTWQVNSKIHASVSRGPSRRGLPR